MIFKDKELNDKVKSMNERLLNISFSLSFNRKLSKKNQSKLKRIEKSLNDEYERLK